MDDFFAAEPQGTVPAPPAQPQGPEIGSDEKKAEYKKNSKEKRDKFIKSTRNFPVWLILVILTVGVVVVPPIVGTYASPIIAYTVDFVLVGSCYWFAKNIAGRYLSGLRWWHGIKSDGTKGWKFEVSPDYKEIQKCPKITLWLCLIAPIVGCIVAIIVCIFTFRYISIVIYVILIIATIPNVVGYSKCLMYYKGLNKKGKFKQTATKAAADYAMQNPQMVTGVAGTVL